MDLMQQVIFAEILYRDARFVCLEKSHFYFDVKPVCNLGIALECVSEVIFDFTFWLSRQETYVRESKIPEQQSRHLVRVVGEKEAFCAVNVSWFPLKDLTFGLVGTDRVCERCVVSGRFWLVLLRLRFCWLTGV